VTPPDHGHDDHRAPPNSTAVMQRDVSLAAMASNVRFAAGWSTGGNRSAACIHACIHACQPRAARRGSAEPSGLGTYRSGRMPGPPPNTRVQVRCRGPGVGRGQRVLRDAELGGLVEGDVVVGELADERGPGSHRRVVRSEQAIMPCAKLVPCWPRFWTA
jgi:hypothetical protein